MLTFCILFAKIIKTNEKKCFLYKFNSMFLLKMLLGSINLPPKEFSSIITCLFPVRFPEV